jgi:hypothetical protein
VARREGKRIGQREKVIWGCGPMTALADLTESSELARFSIVVLS